MVLVGWLALAGAPVVFDVEVGCVDGIGESLDELPLFSSRAKENKKRNIIHFHF